MTEAVFKLKHSGLTGRAATDACCRFMSTNVFDTSDRPSDLYTNCLKKDVTNCTKCVVTT